MWEALQSIIIGLLAPAGVWLGWFLRRRDKASQHDQETKSLLRAKAEEIYQEIEAIRSRNSAGLMGAIEYLYLPNAPMGDLMPPLGRLRSLVHMYFPAGAAVLAEYDIAIHPPVKVLRDTIAAIGSDVTVDERLKISKEARVKCVQEASDIMIEFLHKVTVFMNGEVKKLL